MLLKEATPFVRQAIITTLNSSTKYDVFYELRSLDCRLFYIFSGKGSITIEGKAYNLSPGSVVLFKAGTRYIWQPDEGYSLESLSVNFDYTQNFKHIKSPFHPIHSDKFSDKDILESIEITDAKMLNFPIVLANATSIESRLRLLTTEFNVADDYYRCELLSCVFKSVLISIVRGVNSEKEYSGNRNLTLTRDIIQYIQCNYDKEISYESLSEVFYMNPVYINRIFRQNSGVSLHTFLLNYRINMAMEILRSSNISVKEIAPMVGFSDLPHFTKTFKKVTGITPSKYRVSGDNTDNKETLPLY